MRSRHTFRDSDIVSSIFVFFSDDELKKKKERKKSKEKVRVLLPETSRTFLSEMPKGCYADGAYKRMGKKSQVVLFTSSLCKMSMTW